MIELDTISIRNFLSYGDYETVVKLDDLGPCLISGNIPDADEASSNKDSNGAGKTTLVEAILWCLFGRTTRLAQPGDKVINWFTKKDCVVELRLKNGEAIRRTRNVDGHNDLLMLADVDQSLGTNAMEQQRLFKRFDLDWDIFCGSTFFSQYGKPWMELSDVKRKEAMERAFHMDKIQFYVECAKDRIEKVKAKQAGLTADISASNDTISTLNNQIVNFEMASARFDEQKHDRIEQAKKTLRDLVDSRDAIKLVEIDTLTKRWAVITEARTKLASLQNTVYALERQARELETDIGYNNKLIATWQSKGSICTACERPIPADYITGKTATPSQKVEELKSQLKTVLDAIQAKKRSINNATTRIEAGKPPITVAQATADHQEWRRRSNSIQRQEQTISGIEAEQNHYNETIIQLRSKVSEVSQKVEELTAKVAKLDRILLHLEYIYRAYHDRRKIKSYMLSEYIPYLNARIAYYSARLKLDLKIEFTNALGTKADKWGYDQFSGGECKRFDVAMMLAMFDLHTLMYGRQCNIIVFDEVDGRLDPRGAEIFADIIRTDFANKVDSVLVISQRPDMRGTLPSEIRIVREDRLSRIGEILK